MDIKLVITDIDGVWTDGGMYYGSEGREWKKFNTSDSAGVLFCQLNDIPICIITGEDTPIVERRAAKLGIEMVWLGIKDKLSVAETVCERLGISLEQVAFIGDDINDLPLMDAAGYSASVPDAPEYVKQHASYITTRRGGAGAFRDFVEHLLRESGLLKSTIAAYVKRLESISQNRTDN